MVTSHDGKCSAFTVGSSNNASEYQSSGTAKCLGLALPPLAEGFIGKEWREWH